MRGEGNQNEQRRGRGGGSDTESTNSTNACIQIVRLSGGVGVGSEKANKIGQLIIEGGKGGGGEY